MITYRWANEIRHGPPVQNMTKEVLLLDTNSLDDDNKWPPQNIQYLIEWLELFLYKVPEAYRKTATIEFSSEMEYDLPSTQLRISYYRPESDQEFAVREARYEAALQESILHRSTIEIK